MGHDPHPQAEGPPPFFLKAGENFLWYTEVPGLGARYPLGVYDEPPPEDVPFIRYVDVGDNFASDLARKLTTVTNDVDDWLDSVIPV